MRAGEFPDGAHVLRAKIDMAAGNMNMRDPVLYRILHAHHPRTGRTWCIYPTYDYAHGQSDAIEGVTHSLCTLEFEDHRPLYDWLIDHLPVPRVPRQYEFARLNLGSTVLSKRALITPGPRRPCQRLGRSQDADAARHEAPGAFRRRRSASSFPGLALPGRDNLVDPAMLDNCVRAHFNRTAPRRMAVLRPLKVVIETWPEGETDELEAINNPEDEGAGRRPLLFSRTLYIERDDFMEDPPRKFFRLAPGREVRLRHAYFITCQEVVKDADGDIVELRCTHDPASRGGGSPDGRKVRGTLHWVSADHAVSADVRLYDRLFTSPTPGSDGDIVADLNPDSLVVLDDCRVEPAVLDAAPGDVLQFERQGYFCVDADSTSERPAFNRTVGLRDSWARVRRNTP